DKLSSQVAKDEEVAGKGIGLETIADQGKQAVERGISLIPLVARTARMIRSRPSLSSIPVIPYPTFPRWTAAFGMGFAPKPWKTQRFPPLPARTAEEPNG